MIRMNDFTSEPDELRRAELVAVEHVLRSGWFILGNEVRQFEGTWAKFCATEFCARVGNGMEAIEVGLRALDIGPGDEVIITLMTAIATVSYPSPANRSSFGDKGANGSGIRQKDFDYRGRMRRC